MPGSWVAIKEAPADAELRDRFATIMHLMDPRYRSLNGDQLASWVKAGGVYGDDPAELFGWFPPNTGPAEPNHMQLALACRYQKAANRAIWLMLGWAAPNFGRGVNPASTLTPGEILNVLGEVAGQLLAWTNSLTPSNPTQGLIVAVRPHSIKAAWMYKLYEQGYFNAISDTPIGSIKVAVNRERVSVKDSFLELRLS